MSRIELTQEPTRKLSEENKDEFSLKDALNKYVQLYKDQLVLMGEDEMEEEDDEDESSENTIENESRNLHNASIDNINYSSLNDH
jgi:hypothetical protein